MIWVQLRAPLEDRASASPLEIILADVGILSHSGAYRELIHFQLHARHTAALLYLTLSTMLTYKGLGCCEKTEVWLHRLLVHI